MTRRIIAIFVMASCMISFLLQAQEVEAFVSGLVRQYPEARLLDIYKSSFQDFMGAEHLVNDKESAKAYLEQELATTEPESLMPWYYEPCGTGGRYIRVSLKAVIDGKITADALLDAFVRSANDPERPTVAQWADRWNAMIGVIDTMGLNLPHYDEDKHFIEQVLEMGRYAISHSPEYRDAYAPHYRIIRHDIFEQEILPLITDEPQQYRYLPQ